MDPHSCDDGGEPRRGSALSIQLHTPLRTQELSYVVSPAALALLHPSEFRSWIENQELVNNDRDREIAR